MYRLRILDRRLYSKKGAAWSREEGIERQRKDSQTVQRRPDGHLSVPERIPGKTVSDVRNVLSVGIGEKRTAGPSSLVRAAHRRVCIERCAEVRRVLPESRLVRSLYVAGPRFRVKLGFHSQSILQVTPKERLTKGSGREGVWQFRLETVRFIPARNVL